MNNVPTLYILHVKYILIKKLRPNLLILSNINNLIDPFLAIRISKVKYPIIKATLLKLPKRILHPQI